MLSISISTPQHRHRTDMALPALVLGPQLAFHGPAFARDPWAAQDSVRQFGRGFFAPRHRATFRGPLAREAIQRERQGQALRAQQAQEAREQLVREAILRNPELHAQATEAEARQTRLREQQREAFRRRQAVALREAVNQREAARQRLRLVIRSSTDRNARRAQANLVNAARERHAQFIRSLHQQQSDSVETQGAAQESQRTPTTPEAPTPVVNSTATGSTNAEQLDEAAQIGLATIASHQDTFSRLQALGERHGLKVLLRDLMTIRSGGSLQVREARNALVRRVAEALKADKLAKKDKGKGKMAADETDNTNDKPTTDNNNEGTDAKGKHVTFALPDTDPSQAGPSSRPLSAHFPMFGRGRTSGRARPTSAPVRIPVAVPGQSVPTRVPVAAVPLSATAVNPGPTSKRVSLAASDARAQGGDGRVPIAVRPFVPATSQPIRIPIFVRGPTRQASDPVPPYSVEAPVQPIATAAVPSQTSSTVAPNLNVVAANPSQSPTVAASTAAVFAPYIIETELPNKTTADAPKYPTTVDAPLNLATHVPNISTTEEPEFAAAGVWPDVPELEPAIPAILTQIIVGTTPAATPDTKTDHDAKATAQSEVQVDSQGHSTQSSDTGMTPVLAAQPATPLAIIAGTSPSAHDAEDTTASEDTPSSPSSIASALSDVDWEDVASGPTAHEGFEVL